MDDDTYHLSSVKDILMNILARNKIDKGKPGASKSPTEHLIAMKIQSMLPKLTGSS